MDVVNTGNTLEHLTVGEFQRTMEFLSEMRNDQRDGLKAVREDVANLHRETMEMKKEITDRQDEANGKLQRHDRAIGDLQMDVGGIMDGKGCPLSQKHIAAMEALTGVGVIPTTSTTATFSTKQKAVGVAALGGAVSLGVFLPQVVSILEWIVKHIK